MTTQPDPKAVHPEVEEPLLKEFLEQTGQTSLSQAIRVLRKESDENSKAALDLAEQLNMINTLTITFNNKGVLGISSTNDFVDMSEDVRKSLIKVLNVLISKLLDVPETPVAGPQKEKIEVSKKS